MADFRYYTFPPSLKEYPEEMGIYLILGKVVMDLQQRESLSINSNDTSVSRSTQLESAIPPSRIASISSWEFVGAVSDDPSNKIELKTFHCEIVNDHDALKAEGRPTFPYRRSGILSGGNRGQLPSLLCRVHKSFMVAPAQIDSIEKDRIKIGDVLIPISETYRKKFFEAINLQGK